jgi:hypothetical protein
VIFNQLGLLGGVHLGLGTVVLGVILLLLFIASIVNVVWFGIFFTLAFEFLLFQDEIAEAIGSAQIANLGAWGILGVALLLSIGFSILFRKKPRWEKWQGRDGFREARYGEEWNSEHFESISNEADGSEIYDRIHFGSKLRYVNSENFEKAVIDCSFGAVKFYFDNAHIAVGGHAEIELQLSFSGAELYIPKHWRLVDKLQRSAIGIEEKNRNQPSDDSPTVILSGSASFSGITIIYV